MALLLVIAMVIISFAMLCFASATDTVADQHATGAPFRFADPMAMQEPPGDYILRAASLWPQQRNLPLYRLFELLPISISILVCLKVRRRVSNCIHNQRSAGLLMALCHILRAPPTIA